MIRILIVAAYAAVRVGLHALLAEESDLEIVGAVNGSEELERLLPETSADVILADYQIGDGSRLLEALVGKEVGLVLLGDSPADYTLLTESALPGWAYLLKEAEGPEIAGAIRAVVAGLVVLDRSVAPLLSSPMLLVGEENESPPVLSGEVLTAREREVLQLMAQGLPNKIIASRLNISLHTVKSHVASTLAKLGAASRTEAVTLGARRGHISL